jgi:hypothetical protein
MPIPAPSLLLIPGNELLICPKYPPPTSKYPSNYILLSELDEDNIPPEILLVPFFSIIEPAPVASNTILPLADYNFLFIIFQSPIEPP